MIFLSAGHYPAKPGASFNGRIEHAEAVRWVNRIAEVIGDACPVGIVPTGPLAIYKRDVTGIVKGPAGRPVIIGGKIDWINRQHIHTPAAILAEIHFNSDPSHAGKGSETLYCPGSQNGRRAAQMIQDAIGGLFSPNRGAKEGWYRMDRPGHSDYIGDIEGDEVVDALLLDTLPVSVIIEPLFIHETERLDQWWMTGCAAIAEVLMKFAATK